MNRIDHNGSAGFSRRASLAITAAAVATGGLPGLRVMVADASPTDPDAYIVELCRQLMEVSADEARHDALAEGAIERYSALSPDLPEALYMREDDIAKGLPFGSENIGTVDRNGAKARFYTERALVYLRNADPAGQERASEILMAWEEWQEKDRRAYENSGLADADETTRALAARREGLLRKIVEAKAVTLRGLAIKAQAANEASYNRAGLVRDLAEELEVENYPTAKAVSISIARDLLQVAMMGGAYEDRI